MTTYIERAAGSPQLHALIIGVNDYPHLVGGGNTPAPKTYGQGQLTSPSVSALATADWLEHKYRNATVPLGSVELLVSAPHASGNPTIPAPTSTNVNAAFARWYARCDTDQDNIAWFYFCGHGLETNTTVLLLEDYGISPLNPWSAAIDFRAMFQNLADFKCQTQVYLVDACRTQITDTLSGLPALKNATPTSFPARDAPIFKGASFGSPALGPPAGISYFSAALLDCLNALGASYLDATDWVIDTSSLGRALVERMWRTRDGSTWKRLRCDIGGGIQNLPPTPLHYLTPAQVRVMSQIVCDPNHAEDEATLTAVESMLGHNFSSMGELRPWSPELPLGDNYTIGGRLLPNSGFNMVGQMSTQRVAPPKFIRKLQVT